jgi:hypothetical protein
MADASSVDGGAEARRALGLRISFTASLDVRLSGELETCLYRTAQESGLGRRWRR